ncbi:MAG: hypothetical protein HJJLKODD_00525 [Phycisphaerae bacterium]|nr:hypothetical protein [Phycisphaerae bacterium]
MRWSLWIGITGLLLLGGCQTPQARSPEARRAMNVPLEADIVSVRTFYKNNPFVSLDPEGDANPEGIKMVYYAVSGRNGQGVPGDGLIRVKLFTIIYPSQGEPYGELQQTWEFNPQQAAGWRSMKKSVMGWAYQFTLNWGDADVYGREIRVVPEFVRNDGGIVRGSSNSFKVPDLKPRIRMIDSTTESTSSIPPAATP